MNLSENTLLCLQTLQDNGYEAFLVGGCVRDFLLGKTPTDIDITTNALPQKVLEIFCKYKCIPTGLQHGTVTVVINSEHFEITTYRIDGDYLNNRHPDSVTFSLNLTDDLSRRDFTVNAMAYNPNTGIIDIFGGKKDLENKIIRAVGDADKRFNEDSLRILRAIRFSAKLGFFIDKNTHNSMLKNANLLNNISVERIYSELCQIIMYDNMYNIFMDNLAIFSVFIPELLVMKSFNQQNPHHIYDVLTHTLFTVDHCPRKLHLRLSALFHDIGKPDTFTIDDDAIGHFYKHAKFSEQITRDILNRLKCDNETKFAVCTLVLNHDILLSPTEKSIKRHLSKFGPDLFFDLLDLKCADDLAKHPDFQNRISLIDTVSEIARKLLDDATCFSLKQLAINGSDLISLGFPAGKIIGEILSDVLNCVIEGDLNNDYNEIYQYINIHYK